MRSLRPGSALVLSCLLLSACGGSDDRVGVPPTGGGGGGGGAVGCASPIAPEFREVAVTVNVPTDSDPTPTPGYTPAEQTEIMISLLLPERCPGDAFPIVLESHGYSGTRQQALGADGSLDPSEAHFPSINTLVRALPYHGYAVISVDERGHGVARPGQAAHRARIIDPAAETQDMIAVLDWAWANAAEFNFQREEGTGIARDLRVGTIGYSYGGGFEMPLVALDGRVDTMIPNGTWNNLVYSLLPGDAVKLGFGSLLCTLAIQGNVNNTPLVANLCNLIGPSGPRAASIRTRADLVAAASAPGSQPRPVASEQELLDFFYTHGAGYFERQQRLGLPWGFGETRAVQRAIPALFIQGNRDTLFNLTDAYLNYRYFKAAGGDVRLFSTEGGHMNPLAQQIEASANCGGVVGVEAMLAWFDQKLKGLDSATYRSLPTVCLSVTPTPAAGEAPANADLIGLTLAEVPVGALSGTGALPLRAETVEASVLPGGEPVFAPLLTVSEAQAGLALAGIPSAERVQVSAGPGATVTPIAYVGVAIRRGGELILVDDEVTPFAALPPAGAAAGTATDHLDNRNVFNDRVLLPGVGELLEAGDELGLVFYENQVQYLPANTGGQAGLPNPYTVVMSGVELPLLMPGVYPGSALSRP
ncbi:MAG TPA: CocE/NonD family hydrolase [Nevskiaceae bacterium]|nr:CocE/NonD family hydrolase [Nevskiaceae bacterium]